MPSERTHFELDTNIQKDGNFPKMLHFRTAAWLVDEYGERVAAKPAASLTGYLFDVDFEDLDACHDYFDSQDGDGYVAWTFLKANSIALQTLGDGSDFTRLVFMDKLHVDAEYRGHGLGNRLLREAAHATSQFPCLAIACTVPLEDKAGRSVDDLAAYYASDRHLRFRSIAQEPGTIWLAADISGFEPSPEDTSWFSLEGPKAEPSPVLEP